MDTPLAKKALKPKVSRKEAASAGEKKAPAAKVRIQLHNVSRGVANFSISGGGNKVRGVTPPEGQSTVRVDVAKRYKVTFWRKPDKKVACSLGPDDTAIFTGTKAHVTYPH